jgi:hypothetical protein
MEKSQSIKEIAKALLVFHSKVQKIAKSEINPFFKSKYADLPAILDSIQEPLQESGLSFCQFPEENSLTTILMHGDSGEFLQGTYNLHAEKINPQGLGSAITYARRYALGAILGLNVDNDDDGNKGSEPKKEKEKPKEYLIPGSETDTISVALFEKITKIDHQNLPLANEILKVIGKESEPIRKYFNNWCLSKAMKYDVATKQYEPIGIAVS